VGKDVPVQVDAGRDLGQLQAVRGELEDAAVGPARCLAIMGTVAGRPAYTRKMAWLMPRMAKAVPYLGYIIIAGTKPA
jgi:hypothetical protein